MMRDFTFAQFKFNSTKSKRTQMKQSNRYTFYRKTESHSGRRRCVLSI